MIISLDLIFDEKASWNWQEEKEGHKKFQKLFYSKIQQRRMINVKMRNCSQMHQVSYPHQFFKFKFLIFKPNS